MAPQPTAAPLTVVAGRADRSHEEHRRFIAPLTRRNRRDAGNDKRTKKGKIYAGSNGKSRPRKPGGEKGPVDPCRGGVRNCCFSTDWRNGSASDSSPEGYVFESRIGHWICWDRTHGGRRSPHRYLTLREWGARQDPAMSVEEVVAAKMADKRKVEITLEDIMDAGDALRSPSVLTIPSAFA